MNYRFTDLSVCPTWNKLYSFPVLPFEFTKCVFCFTSLLPVPTLLGCFCRSAVRLRHTLAMWPNFGQLKHRNSPKRHKLARYFPPQRYCHAQRYWNGIFPTRITIILPVRIPWLLQWLNQINFVYFNSGRSLIALKFSTCFDENCMTGPLLRMCNWVDIFSGGPREVPVGKSVSLQLPAYICMV